MSGPHAPSLVRKVRGLPEGPGVYLLLGRERLPIYVGKSVNLRRRVREHLRPGELASGIHDLACISTETELHALLLEDELIKRHRPAHNRRQKKFLLRRYLALDRSAGALRVVDTAQASRRSEVFGPYPDEHFAADLLAFVARYFGLRGAPPSTGRVARDVAGAVAFLEGEGEELAARIRGEMNRHSVGLAFELASAARDRLRFAESYLRHQKFFADFTRRSVLVEDLARPGGAYLFVRGRLLGHWPATPLAAELLRLAAAGPLPPEPDFALRDRANVVRSWVAARRATRRLLVL
ncbi:MAG: excinuclease ABC subunit UvrC [Myxococcaceae bacterium]